MKIMNVVSGAAGRSACGVALKRRWCRLFAADVDTVRLLSPDVARAWVMVLCLAAEHDGRVPALDVAARRLGMKRERLFRDLALLQRAGLIVIDGTGGCVRPIDWAERRRATDLSTPRVRALRARLKQFQQPHADARTI